MDYGEIISRAWRITWNNKYLWVLGFLAALTSVGSNGNSFNYSLDQGDFADPEQLMRLGAMALLVTCILLIVGFMLWLLSVAARGGLVAAVDRLDNGETMTLGEAFGAGTRVIWRVIGIYLLVYLPVILVSALMGVLLAVGIGGTAVMGILSGDPEAILAGGLGATMGLLFLCFCLLLCVMIPALIVLFYLAEFSLRAAIVDDLRVMDSIRQGWRVIRENLGPVILLAVLMFVISLMVGMALGVIMLPFAAILITPMMLTMGTGNSMDPFSLAWLIGGSLCLGIFGAALMSVVQTWVSAVWTLAYKELTGKRPDDEIPADKLAY
jgi:hypothetical protein